MANLASVLTQLGEYARAEAVSREALAVFKRRLDPGHPRIAFLTENLANAVIEQGTARQAEALALYRASLEGVRQRFGPDHTETGLSTGNLAGALHRMGRDAEALPLAQESVRILTASLGPAAPSVAIVHGKVATILINLGRTREAAASLDEADRVLDAAALPAVHSTRKEMIQLRGAVALADHRPADAEPLLRRALDMQRQLQGGDSPMLAENQLALGDCLRQLGRLDEAAPLLTTAQASLLEVRGPDDPLTREAAAAMEALHAAQAAR